jgi:hypothetical protein
MHLVFLDINLPYKQQQFKFTQVSRDAMHQLYSTCRDIDGNDIKKDLCYTRRNDVMSVERRVIMSVIDLEERFHCVTQVDSRTHRR